MPKISYSEVSQDTVDWSAFEDFKFGCELYTSKIVAKAALKFSKLFLGEVVVTVQVAII